MILPNKYLNAGSLLCFTLGLFVRGDGARSLTSYFSDSEMHSLENIRVSKG